jgi:cobalamin-dependent methionine synthase I
MNDEDKKLKERNRINAYQRKHYHRNKQLAGEGNEAAAARYQKRLDYEAKKYAERRSERIIIKRVKRTPEEVKEYLRNYYINNKDAYKKHSVKNYDYQKLKNKIDNDELFCAKWRLRCAVWQAFNRIGQDKPARTEKLLGCSWIEAKEHLESLFEPGMSWSNHGEWHIDHIRPVCCMPL